MRGTESIAEIERERERERESRRYTRAQTTHGDNN